MPQGFFQSSEIQTKCKTIPLLPQCGACGLLKTCESPKMPVTGKGKRGILIVGEAPGEKEDEQNRQFVGKSGQYLRKVLSELGVDANDECWFTNALICRPPDNKITDRRMVEYCRPNIIKTIGKLKPEVIILLGGTAVESVIGWLWKEDCTKLEPWTGWQIPCQKINAWICPTYHPSYILRELQEKKSVPELFFKSHLEQAFNITGRPYDDIPDYKSDVLTLLSEHDAAKQIRGMADTGKPVSFDYETNMLKPDSSEARIVCCAISDGNKAIAYPWHGAAIKATRELLLGPLPKVGASIKFEDRWTRAMLGESVRNWQWDGVVTAHTLDNRKGICSVKFQAFVRLGQESYDDHIKPYLKSPNGWSNEPNRIHEVKLDDLLLYCGLDSLLEHKIATLQMREASYD